MSKLKYSVSNFGLEHCPLFLFNSETPGAKRKDQGLQEYEEIHLTEN